MIKVEIGDISKARADCIVNAPDRSLVSGGEVNEAVQKAAGPELARACEGLGGCAVGECKHTPGFGMKCKHILHAVGPSWERGNSGDDDKLASCYKNCLVKADELECRSIAFPAISTGMFHYPRDRAARIALRAVRDYMERERKKLRKVVFVLHDQEDFDIFRRVWDEMNA